MEAINARVVHRSAALGGYGPGFKYRESMQVGAGVGVGVGVVVVVARCCVFLITLGSVPAAPCWRRAACCRGRLRMAAAATPGSAAAGLRSRLTQMQMPMQTAARPPARPPACRRRLACSLRS
jgi:hypothetical protein